MLEAIWSLLVDVFSIKKWIVLDAILVMCTLTRWINENFYLFMYKWFGFIWIHMNIYVFLSNLNIVILVDRFLTFLVPFFYQFSSRSNQFLVQGVYLFNEQFGSDNYVLYIETFPMDQEKHQSKFGCKVCASRKLTYRDWPP